MCELKDVTGTRFGSLVAIERIGQKYDCLCDCGNHYLVDAGGFRAGKITKCLLCRRDRKSLLNKTFGALTVIAFDKVEKGKSFWLCECKCGDVDCKKIISAYQYNLRRNKNVTCKRGRKREKNKQWTGCGEISGKHWAAIKSDAKKRDIKFELSIEEAWEKFEEQNKKCGLTGDKLFFGELYTGPKEFRTTASLDRIENNKHYFKDNIWWVHTDINNIKNKLSVKELLYWCNLIVNKYEGNDEIIYDKNKRCHHWKGYELISGGYWSRVVRQAEKRNILVEIKIEDAWNQYLKQNGRCSLTGLPILMDPGDYANRKQVASLDRIDSNKGYTLDNISWVHKQINRIKWEYSNEYFIEMCSKIHHYNKENNR